MKTERCEDCERRFDRPAHPYCGEKEKHVEPDKAQKIVQLIEDDLTDRRGLRQEFDAVDRDTQDEIRDTWAEIIRKELQKNA